MVYHVSCLFCNMPTRKSANKTLSLSPLTKEHACAILSISLEVNRFMNFTSLRSAKAALVTSGSMTFSWITSFGISLSSSTFVEVLEFIIV